MWRTWIQLSVCLASAVAVCAIGKIGFAILLPILVLVVIVSLGGARGNTQQPERFLFALTYAAMPWLVLMHASAGVAVTSCLILIFGIAGWIVGQVVEERTPRRRRPVAGPWVPKIEDVDSRDLPEGLPLLEVSVEFEDDGFRGKLRAFERIGKALFAVLLVIAIVISVPWIHVNPEVLTATYCATIVAICGLIAIAIAAVIASIVCLPREKFPRSIRLFESSLVVDWPDRRWIIDNKKLVGFINAAAWDRAYLTSSPSKAVLLLAMPGSSHSVPQVLAIAVAPADFQRVLQILAARQIPIVNRPITKLLAFIAVFLTAILLIDWV